MISYFLKSFPVNKEGRRAIINFTIYPTMKVLVNPLIQFIEHFPSCLHKVSLSSACFWSAWRLSLITIFLFVCLFHDELIKLKINDYLLYFFIIVANWELFGRVVRNFSVSWFVKNNPNTSTIFSKKFCHIVNPIHN